MTTATLMALALFAAQVPQSPSPEATAAEFVDAFRAMDEARFDKFFAPEATMFFPGGAFPKARVDGRDAVLATFHSFFARARERGRKSLNIVPNDLRVEQFGEVAVVSFWLDGEQELGRRSLILHKVRDDWRIVHFHASTTDK